MLPLSSVDPHSIINIYQHWLLLGSNAAHTIYLGIVVRFPNLHSCDCKFREQEVAKYRKGVCDRLLCLLIFPLWVVLRACDWTIRQVVQHKPWLTLSIQSVHSWHARQCVCYYLVIFVLLIWARIFPQLTHLDRVSCVHALAPNQITFHWTIKHEEEFLHRSCSVRIISITAQLRMPVNFITNYGENGVAVSSKWCQVMRVLVSYSYLSVRLVSHSLPLTHEHT